MKEPIAIANGETAPRDGSTNHRPHCALTLAIERDVGAYTGLANDAHRADSTLRDIKVPNGPRTLCTGSSAGYPYSLGGTRSGRSLHRLSHLTGYLASMLSLRACREFINHGDDTFQNHAAHPKVASLNILAAK